ncbi:hypothetical protein LH426_10015, partial [Laribacter hongkongensis]|uniref:hypothetical protein n=1 Tax=Laribacter hongkongensis TaxID=168471 RepID=UPI001EFC9681
MNVLSQIDLDRRIAALAGAAACVDFQPREKSSGLLVAKMLGGLLAKPWGQRKPSNQSRRRTQESGRKKAAAFWLRLYAAGKADQAFWMLAA